MGIFECGITTCATCGLTFRGMTSYESSTIISNVERDQDQFRQKYAASLDSVDKTRSSLIFDIDEC